MLSFMEVFLHDNWFLSFTTPYDFVRHQLLDLTQLTWSIIFILTSVGDLAAV
jgi:hypothetical protein